MSFNFGTNPTSTTTTTTSSFTFGAPTTTTTSSFSFGAPTATTTSTFSFGTPVATTTASGTGGFTGLTGFGTSTTSAGSTFGTSSFGNSTGTGSFFGGFGTNTTSSGSTFGSSAGTGGFFGNTQQQQQQQQAANQLDNLAKAVMMPHIFNDERDSIIAKWNLLQAYWGTGQAYFDSNGFVDLTSENLLCRFKAIGYSCIPQNKDEDGFVGLVLKKSYSDIKFCSLLLKCFPFSHSSFSILLPLFPILLPLFPILLPLFPILLPLFPILLPLFPILLSPPLFLFSRFSPSCFLLIFPFFPFSSLSFPFLLPVLSPFSLFSPDFSLPPRSPTLFLHVLLPSFSTFSYPLSPRSPTLFLHVLLPSFSTFSYPLSPRSPTLFLHVLLPLSFSTLFSPPLSPRSPTLFLHVLLPLSFSTLFLPFSLFLHVLLPSFSPTLFLFSYPLFSTFSYPLSPRSPTLFLHVLLPSFSTTEMVIYIVERQMTGQMRRYPTSKVVEDLNNVNVKKKMEDNPLFVEHILSKRSLNTEQMKSYLENPPAGIDPLLWQQAKKDNPDPESFVPIPIVGFQQLQQRLKQQEQQTKCHQSRIDLIAQELNELQNKHRNTIARVEEAKRKHLNLGHRLLKVIAKQEVYRKLGVAMQDTEEQFRAQLEALQSELNHPTQFKGRLNELLSQIRMQNHMTASRADTNYQMEPLMEEEIRELLKQQQTGIHHIIQLMKDDSADLCLIEEGLADISAANSR
ncbi:NUP54 [Acanthosepion pharaonis]|uniref:NUP54 n=1 Tax=Acanthosepion pharaonis TaxID=158019 RepID=A0A812BWM9_ACAPH|nr:NUP54 [Sepia pharaonis]